MYKRFLFFSILFVSSTLDGAITGDQFALLEEEAQVAQLALQVPLKPQELSLDENALPEDKAATIIFNRLVRRGGAYDETLIRLNRLTKIFLFKKDLQVQPSSELFEVTEALLGEALERCSYLYDTLDQAYRAYKKPYFRTLPDVQGPPLLQHNNSALRAIIAQSLGMETVVKQLESQLPGRDWLPWQDKQIKNQIYDRLAQINSENNKLHGAAKEAHRELHSLYAVVRRGNELAAQETVVRRQASRLAGWAVVKWFQPKSEHGVGSLRAVRDHAKAVGTLPKMPTFSTVASPKPVQRGS